MFDGIVTSEKSIRVVACPNPLTADRIEFFCDPEQRISDIVARVSPYEGLAASVWVGSDENIEDQTFIPREFWNSVRPKPGARVTIRIVPRGGGGGGIGRIVLSLAVMAISFFAAPAIATALGFTGATAFSAFGMTVTWMQIGTGLVGMGISMIGSILINALVPPPSPKVPVAPGGGSFGLSTSPTLTITGTQNRANPYGPVPRVYGRHRVFPTLGAAQYTETVGNDQYLRVLFDFGYGPLRISDLKIGQTPIYLFQGVEIAVSNPDATWTPWTYVVGKVGDTVPPLYSNTVRTDQFSIRCLQNISQIVTTRAGVDEAEIDLSFNGLVTFSGESRTSTSVDVRIEYREFSSTGPWYGVSPTGGTTQPAQFSDSAYMAAYPEVAGSGYGGTGTGYWGTGTPGNFIPINAGASRAWDHYLYQGRSVGNEAGWTGGGSVYTITAATEQTVYRTYKAKFPSRSQYQIRVTRLTADNTSIQTRNDFSITTLRSVTYTPPAVPSGRALIAIRIKATNQLNGIIQNFSAVAEAMLPIWNGTSWSAPTITRNPAWAFCDVLRGQGNKRPVSDSRIDLAAIKVWADYCDELAQDGRPRFQFDAIYDSRTTIFQALMDIAATARATLTMANFRFGVVVDRPRTTPVQLFTPRNSWGFRSKKTFVKNPHALKAKFTNPEKDWSQDEVIYYTPGYTETTATLFETVEMFGVTRSNQAWRDLAFHYANGILRPEEYEIQTGIESIVCTKGDLVKVAHDVPRFGLAWGRVKQLEVSGTNVVGITLDERFIFDPAKSYAFRVRRSDGVQLTGAVVNSGSGLEENYVSLVSPIPVSGGPAVGDIIAIGESAIETVSMVVKAIYRQKDFTARIVMTDEAPGVYTADTGTIPIFATQTTWPGQGINLDPTPPVIAEIASDETAMFRTANGFVPAIRITFAQRSGVMAATDYVEVQVRPINEEDDWRSISFPNAPSIVYVTPIDDGAAYDLRCRYVSVQGRASTWTVLNAYIAAGRTALPPNVAQVSISNGMMSWPYANPPNDLAGFQVMWSQGWTTNPQFARLAHPEGSFVWSPFPLSAFPRGRITVFVYAVDTAGNASARPAIAQFEFAEPDTSNIVEFFDVKALGFPGVRPSTVIEGGNLKATPAVSFWSDDNALFWGADADPFWPLVIYNDFVYEFTVLPSRNWVPLNMGLDYEILADAFSIEFRRRGSAPMWGPLDGAAFWSPDDSAQFWADQAPWSAWPGGLNIGYETVDFRISAVSGSTGGRAEINRLRAIFDVPDITEEIGDFTLPSLGGRLPITKSYRVIKTVELDVLENGSGGVTAKVVDRDAVLGPFVQTLSAAGTSVAGKVTARVRGF